MRVPEKSWGHMVPAVPPKSTPEVRDIETGNF